MRLGDLLVEAGKLTQAEVEEALKGQAIFGGRFGTNLIEMGLLDERELALFLSKKTGVPNATTEQLMDVPHQILKLVPEEMVKKYRVIPVGLNNRKLILAMADPSNFAAIDEISFVTGYIVQPVITPEIRLITALEKHYNIRREMRYIKVEGGGRYRGRQPVTTPTTPAPEPARQAMPTRRPQASATPIEIELEEAEILDLPLLSELEPLEEMEEFQAGNLPPVSGKSSFGGEIEFVQPIMPPIGSQAREPEKDYSLKGVLLGFTEAEDREDIADLIVNYAAQEFHRSALFLLKNGKASGWKALCEKVAVADFNKLEIDLEQPSVLKVVSDTKTFYMGPIPPTPANNALLKVLGGGTPLNNILVPLVMAGRVVAILYAEGATLRPDEAAADLQRLMTKASLAFEILILKNKILLT
ncbi:hypothetical protein [Geomonas sp.]|uniref:GspE/PulE/PilB domain-containing protein n=1 Tax=Geomonas sp. TaxID=2651584 RepID=UPI002B48D710|nr:hypothetical protein [Geomonas sp.]HJV34902.1 hypothetical protein [Geomonas sp.]